jgi:hypothetical protein
MNDQAMKRAALEELRHKTLVQIQVETAYTWAYRSWAARQHALDADAQEYAHEALEHAALSEDDQVLADVRRIIAG